MCEVGFDSRGYIGKDIARLLPAGFDHRQHGFDKAAAPRALRPEGELPADATSCVGTD